MSDNQDDLLKGIGALVVMLLYYFACITLMSSVIMIFIGKFSLEVALYAIAAFFYVRWYQKVESKIE